MPNLEQVIDGLNELHDLRKQIQELCTDGAAVLQGDLKNKEPIPLPDDPISRGTALAGLQLIARQGGREHPPREQELLAVLRLLPLRSLMLRRNVTDPHGGEVPLLVAARTLRALSLTPGEGLSRAALCCYYRIARELYTPSPPDFATGGIRAGERGMATAFQTGECTRAVLLWADMLDKSAEVFDYFDRWRRALEICSRPEIPAAWRKHELERVHSALRANVRARARDLGFGCERIDPLLDGSHDGLTEPALRKAVSDAIQGIPAAFEAALTECRQERSQEQEADGRIAERSLSAHLQALRALEDGLELAKTLVIMVGSGHWDGAAKALRKEIDRVYQLLRPAESFLKAVLARELAEASADAGPNICDYPELAFAASTYGLIRYGRHSLKDVTTSWDHPHLKRAARVLIERMGTDGLFPVGRPLTADSWGSRLEVVGFEVTHALAELLGNVDVDLGPDVVRKMLSLFYQTRDEETGGWGYEQVPPPLDAEYWTTALATIALQAMVGMLNARIRSSVLKHFSVRWPKKIDLDTLFYGDVGLAASRGRPSLATYLHRMREHLMGVTARGAGRICSIVLYGPPGTGKTTLPEALAASAGMPLIEITPSDLVSGGANLVEHRARIVFQALSLLSEAVIIFDEFDSVLRRREQEGKIENVFEFLTPGMLPKLKNLHESAEERRMAYVLSTNLVGSLDEAAIRDGRFDARVGVFPPDVLSRAGRLMSQVIKQGSIEISASTMARVATVVAETASGGMTQLGKPGWFTAPKKAETETPFHYISFGDAASRPRRGEPEKPRPARPVGKGLSAAEEWQDWTVLDHWDEKLRATATWSDLEEVLEDRPPRPPLPADTRER